MTYQPGTRVLVEAEIHESGVVVVSALSESLSSRAVAFREAVVHGTVDEHERLRADVDDVRSEYATLIQDLTEALALDDDATVAEVTDIIEAVKAAVTAETDLAHVRTERDNLAAANARLREEVQQRTDELAVLRPLAEDMDRRAQGLIVLRAEVRRIADWVHRHTLHDWARQQGEVHARLRQALATTAVPGPESHAEPPEDVAGTDGHQGPSGDPDGPERRSCEAQFHPMFGDWRPCTLVGGHAGLHTTASGDTWRGMP
jgi:hypothetical protein